MTLMSEQLIVADTQLGEASNQNGPLDAGMLSSPIVDASCQLICLVIYQSFYSISSNRKSLCVRNKPQYLIEEP